MWIIGVAADDKSRAPPHRDPGAGLLLRPHARHADREVEPGRLDDGERIAVERPLQADDVHRSIRTMSLPEGGDRTAAQLRALAAVAAEERVAIERRVEHARNEERC